MRVFFFFSSRRRHTRCALVTGVQTCALPISTCNHARFAALSQESGMTKSYTREDTRRIAAILAEAAQAEVMPRFRRLSADAVRAKSSPRDLVTEADEAAERFIAARLAKLHPGAVMVGEEASARNPALLNMLVDADLAFLIDPIDGTRNFVAGLPLFGMMVAVCHRGRSEEHTSELQSLMRISYAVFCLKKKKQYN